MRHPGRRLVLLSAVLVAFGTVLATPGAAVTRAAATPGDATFQTITADFNGDGIPDQATLGQIGTNQNPTCTVTVRFGKPDGTFSRPVVHTYLFPPHGGPLCPDLGVAVKLGNHRRPDLVTGAGFGIGQVLVLHDFRPAAVYFSILQPDVFRTADLNGDGRQDIIEISSQEESFTTLINTKQGTLIPGPITACAHNPQYVLADFNGDGGQDMLVSARCLLRPLGVSVQVLFGNGQAPVTLLSTPDLTQKYTVFAIDLDYDGIPDAGVITLANGVTTVQYFRNDGHGKFTPVP